MSLSPRKTLVFSGNQRVSSPVRGFPDEPGSGGSDNPGSAGGQVKGSIETATGIAFAFADCTVCVNWKCGRILH